MSLYFFLIQGDGDPLQWDTQAGHRDQEVPAVLWDQLPAHQAGQDQVLSLLLLRQGVHYQVGLNVPLKYWNSSFFLKFFFKRKW